MSRNRKKLKLNIFKELVLPFLISFIIGLLAFSFSANYKNQSSKKEIVKILEEKSAPKDKLKELIELEKFIYLDPMVLLQIIDSNTSEAIIIDLRDNPSYQKAHIKGAVTYPKEKLTRELSKLKKKKIILYSDTAYSLTAKETILTLLNKGFDVRLLSIGWNEFRHFKNLWVPESSWDKIDVNKYIQTND